MTVINHSKELEENFINYGRVNIYLKTDDDITSSGRLILSNADKQKITQLQYQCDTLGLNTLNHTLNKLTQNPPIKIKHILQTAYLCHFVNETHYQLPIVITQNEE